MAEANPSEAKSKRKLSPEQVAEAAEQYLSGVAALQIARQYGVTATTLISAFHRAGVPLRSRSQAQSLAQGKRKINDGLTNSTRQYRRKRAAGLCTRCGNPNSNGKRQCSLCHDIEDKRRKERMSNGQCCSCGTPISDGFVNCENCRALKMMHHHRLKDSVFAAYGGYRCSCCGVTDRVFLCLDHINNDGAMHRRTGHGEGTRLYRWLKRHGYPPGFQVLCHNCNFAKQFGPCPHQTRQEPKCEPVI